MALLGVQVMGGRLGRTDRTCLWMGGGEKPASCLENPGKVSELGRVGLGQEGGMDFSFS